MNRETKIIEIAGRKFEVKTYASARETQAIQAAYFKGTKVEMTVGDQPKISEFNPAVRVEVEKEMVAQMLVSLDGSTEDIVNRCLDLPNEVYAELVADLDGIVSKKKS